MEYNPQKYLTFKESTLEYLPKSLIDAFPNVTHLNLNDLKITSIEPNAFEKAANLQTMYLEANRLINIDQNAFSGANKLQVLVLSGNEITFFDYYAFNSNPDLQYLYLNLNQLDALPRFMYNTKLKFLNVSHNNLRSINDYHFHNQRNLKTLDVSFNRLKRLNLQHLDADLDLVDVSSNVLTDFTMPTYVNCLNARNNSLTEFVVSHQCTLEKLILAQNKLQTQPMIENCSSLEYLDLSHNLLEAFSYQKSMVNVQYLKLAHNNLFEIYLPIEIPSKSFSLKVLDLSVNNLSQGPALHLFKKLEWASFNDNYLISLMSYANEAHTNFKGYRMANNEWSCAEIQKFDHWTRDKTRNPCAVRMRNLSGICCRDYSSPYNDRLNEILREAGFHERANKKKYSKPLSTISNPINLDEIHNAIASANAEEADTLRKIEEVRKKVFNNAKKLEYLKNDLNRLYNAKRNVAREIERQRQFHRLTREGLITDKEILERIIKFVWEKDTYNEDLLSRRQKETEESNHLFYEKQCVIEQLKNNIANLQATNTALQKEEIDQMKQFWWEADFHEHANEKKCSKPVSTISNPINLDEIHNAIASANAVEADTLRKIEEVRKNAFNNEKSLENLQTKLNRLYNARRNVAREIERQRQSHRVTREGLITDKEILERLIKFVQEIDAGNEDILSRRKNDTIDSNSLFDEKQQEIIELKKNIAYLQATHNALKKEEKDKKKQKDQLQRIVNKNPVSIHGG